MKSPEAKSAQRNRWEDVIRRLPSHRGEVTSFCQQFPHARDLVVSNPALGICISCALVWDTLHKQIEEGLIERLLHMKRRDACKLLGFPGTESVVRILAKVRPVACEIPFLMRVRRRLSDPGLARILSHLRKIGKDELEMAAHWEPSPHATLPLFLEVAAETTGNAARKLFDTERMMERSGKHFSPLRSAAEVERWYLRLAREETRREAETLSFPAPPIAGTDTILPIVHPKDLHEEGYLQRNCVGDYARDIASGRMYIYRLLTPERATVGIMLSDGRWQLWEISGSCNSRVSDGALAEIQTWLAEAQFQQPPFPGSTAIEPISSSRDLYEVPDGRFQVF